MKNTNNKLYFPLFYKYLPLISWLSKEELGELVYAIMVNSASLPSKEPLSDKIEAIYTLMVNDANSIFEKNLPKGAPKKEQSEQAPKAKERYGNFDPVEAFEKALQRSYSGSTTPKSY